MKDLIKTINAKGETVYAIDSREVAEMLGKTHAELLKEIDGRKDKKGIGIIPVLTKGNFHLVDYSKETQPMYYEEKFEELLKELGIK